MFAILLGIKDEPFLHVLVFWLEKIHINYSVRLTRDPEKHHTQRRRPKVLWEGRKTFFPAVNFLCLFLSTLSRIPVNRVCVSNWTLFSSPFWMRWGGKCAVELWSEWGKSLAHLFSRRAKFKTSFSTNQSGIQKSFRWEFEKYGNRLLNVADTTLTRFRTLTENGTQKNRTERWCVLDFRFTFRWKFISTASELFSRDNRTKRARKLFKLNRLESKPNSNWSENGEVKSARLEEFSSRSRFSPACLSVSLMRVRGWARKFFYAIL